MRTKLLLAVLMTSTILASASLSQARGGFPAPPLPPPPPLLPPPPGVSVSVSGYLPAPPGVHVYVDAGRPYYVEHGRRVYMKKKQKGHHGQRHGDHGRKLGHYKH